MSTNLLRRNALFWAHHIRDVFIPDIDAFARCLVERLLPTFGKLEEEADRVEQDAWDRPRYAEDVDPADVVEDARNEALAFLDTMQGIKQGLINMFAVGLYHTFEQQLLLFHRRGLLRPHEQGKARLWEIGEAKERLKDAGINIEKFTSWPPVKELQLLANTVKHADGRSCNELKALRPELFVRPRCHDPTPADEGLRNAYLRAPVFQPLVGESVYVTREQFKDYAAAVHRFLEELAEALEASAVRD